jgi:hypothetical protein
MRYIIIACGKSNYVGQAAKRRKQPGDSKKAKQIKVFYGYLLIIYNHTQFANNFYLKKREI